MLLITRSSGAAGGTTGLARLADQDACLAAALARRDRVRSEVEPGRQIGLVLRCGQVAPTITVGSRPRGSRCPSMPTVVDLPCVPAIAMPVRPSMHWPSASA